VIRVTLPAEFVVVKFHGDVWRRLDMSGVAVGGPGVARDAYGTVLGREWMSRSGRDGVSL
jgi:hypothetical protein